jgi:nucleoside-diphosphate-sugar epimerase
VEFIKGDLLDSKIATRSVKDIEYLFHLAAIHGGRGYVDLHNVECAMNLVLDGQLFREAVKAHVEKIIFASSGCVYPNHLQSDPTQELYLTEDLVGPPYDADNMYGWAKLMGELTLQHFVKADLLKAASCRYFTVYGPRGKEDHAVIAMIARAFIQQNPFEVWGTGEQIRNWTYIDDIVEGTILAAEGIDDGTAVNLGTMERIRVVDAAAMILRHMGVEVPLKFLPHMPTGPYNRVAANRLAKELIGWQPRVPFREGIVKTIDWYVKNRNPDEVRSQLQSMLTER